MWPRLEPGTVLDAVLAVPTELFVLENGKFHVKQKACYYTCIKIYKNQLS